MKKLVVTVLIIGGCLYFAKKSSLFSYAGTIWSQVKAETKNAIPTRFELGRVRHEIALLDDDISRMIRPIAEYQGTIIRLKKDIALAEQKVSEHKSLLLSRTDALQNTKDVLVQSGGDAGMDRTRVALAKDFQSYKHLEANLASRRKLLEANLTSLQATQDQLAKVLAKKREYEVRVAQLEADEETLQIARIGSKLQVDDSRATQIEAALADIEHRQVVQRAEVELRTGNLAKELAPVAEPGSSVEEIHAMRAYLERAAR